jgi:hypothetical protein
MFESCNFSISLGFIVKKAREVLGNVEESRTRIIWISFGCYVDGTESSGTGTRWR